MPFSLKTLQLLTSTGASAELVAQIIASVQADFGVVERELFVPREPRTSRRRRAGSPVSDAKRLEVLQRNDYKCAYCPCDEPAKMTVDHIFPRSKGGTNDLANLTTACRACNNAKGDMAVEEFLRGWRSREPADDGHRPLPERRPYTLRDLRRPTPKLPALLVTRKSQYSDSAPMSSTEREDLRAFYKDAPAYASSVLSASRAVDRDIVVGAQRALANNNPPNEKKAPSAPS
jgi:hypothetical protein